MKIVIASDSFKGCCTSLEAATAFECGILRASPGAEIIKIVVADGGEGTVEALVNETSGVRKTIKAHSPTGELVNATYGIINTTTAIIEMAAASGLPLVPEEKRNPLYTTTIGTGELIRDALDCGCTKIVIGIGGSATNDGGLGMAQALGYQFTDNSGKPLGSCAIELSKLKHIDSSNVDLRLKQCEIIALCDVTNPLSGPDGATYVYGPQKGARTSDLPLLDSNLCHFAKIIKEQLDKDILTIPGGGAAGGLGAGLLAFCNAQLKPGIETILALTGLESHLSDADLVITGEGSIDSQSAFGKVPAGVARIAKRYNIPVIAIVGSIGNNIDTMYKIGIDSIMSIISSPMSLDRAISDFSFLAADASERMMRMVRIAIRDS